MADQIANNNSNLITRPSLSSPVYSRRPKLFKPLGVSRTYVPKDNTFREASKPSIKRLNFIDKAYKNEPLIRQGLEFISLAVLQRINSYEHEDPLIEEFITKSLLPKMPSIVKKILISLLKYGSTTAELMYEYKDGPSNIPQVILKDFIVYHPLSVDIQLNNYKQLTHGEKVVDSMYKSGVWVPLPSLLVDNRKSYQGGEIVGSKIRLPEYKCFHMSNTIEGDSPFGTSLLESILPYHLYKEAFTNMMWIALDRYGTPFIYVKVPNIHTGKTVIGVDGEPEPVTLYDEVVEAVENLSDQNALVLTQNSKDQPVDIGTLTTGNNFSDSFIQAIQFCDENMIMGLGIPNLLFRDKTSTLGSGQAGETQLEVFNSFIDSFYMLVSEHILEQIVGNLIDLNFSRDLHPLGQHRGVFTKRPPRFSDLKVVIAAIETLDNLGYVNKNNKTDFDWVRDLVNAPKRDLDTDEQSFREQELLSKMNIAMSKSNNADSSNV